MGKNLFSGYAEQVPGDYAWGDRHSKNVFVYWLFHAFWSSLLLGGVILGISSLVVLSFVSTPFQGYAQAILASFVGISLFGFYINTLYNDFIVWKRERDFQKQKAKWVDAKAPNVNYLLSSEDEQLELALQKAKTSDNPVDQLFYEVGSLEKQTGWSLSTFIIWMAFVKEVPKNMDILTFVTYVGVVNKVIQLYEAANPDNLSEIPQDISDDLLKTDLFKDIYSENDPTLPEGN